MNFQETQAKVQKFFFSYFIDLLCNILAVNLFLGILARIKYLNFQRGFSPV